jgi:hypothetical protein
METEDNDWEDTTMGRYLNSGGYGIGYILDAKMPPKPAVAPLLVLENPEKLTKIRRQNVILFYVEQDYTKPETLLTYSWRAEDVLGQKGTLKIEREIKESADRAFSKRKQVLFRWNGEDGGSEWVDVDRVKDPQFVLDYIESCLNGKHSLPF